MHNDPPTVPQAPDSSEHACGGQPVGRWRSWWDHWQQLPWSGRLLLLLTACVILVVGYSLLSPRQWIFNVQAQTRIVEIVTPDDNETKWRVDGAILCTRGSPKPSVDRLRPLERGDPRCGSPRWTGYQLLESEQILVMRGQLKTTIEQRVEGLVFAIRAQQHPPGARPDTTGVKQPLVLLSFTDGTPDIPLGNPHQLRINLVFPAARTNPVRERVFPFIGETTIGRDVNWAGSSLLSGGSIEVYTADVTADKRKQIDKADLLLGDQVRLAATQRAGTSIYPKGFVRSASSGELLDVIAFGAANRVRIERFGDNGYDLRPSLLLQLLNDSLLLLVVSSFVAAVGLISGMASVTQTDKKS